MSWFTVKSFPDLAGAVNKISESVKNIEKNFDNALGLEENSESSRNNEASSSARLGAVRHSSNAEEEKGLEADRTLASASKQIFHIDQSQLSEDEKEVPTTVKDSRVPEMAQARESLVLDRGKVDSQSSLEAAEPKEPIIENVQMEEAFDNMQQEESGEGSSEILMSAEEKSGKIEVGAGSQTDKTEASSVTEESHKVADSRESLGDEHDRKTEEATKKTLPGQSHVSVDSHDGLIKTDRSSLQVGTNVIESAVDESSHDQIQPIAHSVEDSSEAGSELVSTTDGMSHKEVETKRQVNDGGTEVKEKQLTSKDNSSDSTNMALELEKVKKEMKMMEAALQGAARQSQAKADEIAKLMNENEQLKAVVGDLKRKTNEAEIQSLREEYHQRLSTLERKVYALTRERDTLRREQNRKSDAAALLKEKDEIITQVMAEGEELSKKQAAQEAQIRKLRTQVRELEEENKGLVTKRQTEENNVESIKRDKAATENLLQVTIEKYQSELAVQKEYYSDALIAAKDAEALAEARANVEGRNEMESRLRDAEERETMLVQALEELRQTLSTKEHQAVSREVMLRKEYDDLQKRYQASERRCEELITQVPDSTRPLLRQIEAIQEATARQAGVWTTVERSLNSRLQEAEAKAKTSQERERSVNERLSQTLSRVNVLEAQISCLRAEQTQLSRNLEKERQRAAENRQEYLVAKEEADTQEGRVNQLEQQIREVRQKHKLDFEKVVMQRERLQQEVEKEKAARFELESTSGAHSTAGSGQSPITKKSSTFENGNLIRKFSSASNLEESYYLQASLNPSDSSYERAYPKETTVGPYHMKNITPGAFESSLRQKQRELQSYMSRLASMESVRDSLAEELVKMTEQCDKLRAEATMLPGIRAELDALRKRHSAALELMGERDEELEELRADIIEMKDMYREQVNSLVNKIQTMRSSMAPP